MPKIEILLATYNGADFLEEQLQSLLDQDEQDFIVTISDDGSTDGTWEIINRYVSSFPDKIKVVEQYKSGGARANFMRLMRSSTAPYVMFCDQDDVWKATKISDTYRQMLSVENLNPGMPVLVHTDLCVTDESLSVRYGSFYKYQNLNPSSDAFDRLLLQNTVVGCTSMINGRLRDLAGRGDSSKIMMHDHWVALIAASIGVVSFYDGETMFYRQHTKNAVGARKYGADFLIRSLPMIGNARRQLYRVLAQAKYFYDLFGTETKVRDKKSGKVVAFLDERNFFSKRWALARHGIRKHGIARTALMYLIV